MNRILIDTHIFLWYFGGDKRLKKEHLSLIENTQNQIFLSQISLFEIYLKISIGKLERIVGLELFLKASEIQILPITKISLETFSRLPIRHRDSFDRYIIAKAISDNLTLMSNDSEFEKYTGLKLLI